MEAASECEGRTRSNATRVITGMFGTLLSVRGLNEGRSRKGEGGGRRSFGDDALHGSTGRRNIRERCG